MGRTVFSTQVVLFLNYIDEIIHLRNYQQCIDYL